MINSGHIAILCLFYFYLGGGGRYQILFKHILISNFSLHLKKKKCIYNLGEYATALSGLFLDPK